MTPTNRDGLLRARAPDSYGDSDGWSNALPVTYTYADIEWAAPPLSS